MRTKTLTTKFPLVLAVLAVTVFAANLLAYNEEDPIEPPPIGCVVSVFGPVVVETPDVGGLVIDAKDAVEPQTTVLLINDELETLSDGTAIITTVPSYGTCVLPAE